MNANILRLDLGCARVLAGSDLHARPGPISIGLASFVWAAAELQPDVIVLDGDVLDGARISRFPRRRFDPRPTVLQELEAGHDQLELIRAAAPNAHQSLECPNVLPTH